MKKWFIPLTMLATLTACSVSNEQKQAANDSYERKGTTPVFTTLDTSGVTIMGKDSTYQLPSITAISTGATDIRPPSAPMAIIGNSVAQFDGERSSIVYPTEKQAVYNIQQVQRLLTEKGISVTVKDNTLETDWTKTGRADEIGDTQIRYMIEEMGNKEARALVVSVLQMKRDDVIFTPTTKDKMRYTSDRLNQLVGELNTAYRQQQQDVSSSVVVGAVQSAMITDANQHLALAMNAQFQQAWYKLGQALPQLGFKIEQEIVGKGYRVLKYKALESNEWSRFGVSQPELENGEYFMQLSVYGKESAVVLSNEDKVALLGEQAQAVYQALQNILAK